MQDKFDNEPIYDLYNHLVDNFTTDCTSFYDKKIDPLLRLILLNNGCKESPGLRSLQKIYDLMDDYKICFVTGMIGNDVNEYYDYLIFNGMKYLVVFVDYFDFVKDGDLDENDPSYVLKMTIGNSIYYDAIKKIVEIFYLTSEPAPAGLLNTVMASNQRWNQAIIAMHIINHFKQVDDNDISDIPMEDVNNILNGNIKLQLYGIRTM